MMREKSWQWTETVNIKYHLYVKLYSIVILDIQLFFLILNL
jgi:hypothetical protein